MSKRTGAKWTVNECLRLQREFELLELTIGEIAELHKRTPKAIMYKLDAEGFADYKEILTKMASSSCGDEYSNECCKADEDEEEAEAEESEVDEEKVAEAKVDESEPTTNKEECSCDNSNQNNSPKKSVFKRFVSKIMKKLF